MENTNEMQLIFDSRSSNESFARVTVAAFMSLWFISCCVQTSL